jgi:hypothetical protein
MWYPVDEPWQYRVLDALPAGVDLAQLRAAQTMTPAERIDAAEELAWFAEELQAARRRARDGTP